jgi:hypothetical protein
MAFLSPPLPARAAARKDRTVFQCGGIACGALLSLGIWIAVGWALSQTF